jgi:RNAse (barnase) inhibitor barstar
MTFEYINHQIPSVRINATKILNWKAFHSYFQREFGFPEFYGRNMNAWIDCMGDLDKPENGMTRITITKGEFLVLRITHVEELKNKAMDIYLALVECSAFVNRSRMETGELPLIILSF